MSPMQIKCLNPELNVGTSASGFDAKILFFRRIQSVPDMFPFEPLDEVDRTMGVGRCHRLPTANASLLNFRSWRPRKHQETKRSDCCTSVHVCSCHETSVQTLLFFSPWTLSVSNAYILMIPPKFAPSPDSPEPLPAVPQRPNYFQT